MTWRSRTARNKSLHLVCSALLLASLVAPVHAASSTRVSWAASASSDVAGYRLQYRTATTSWSDPIDVGNVTTWTLEGLDPATTYYFTVTAYDRAGNSSVSSAEGSGRPTPVGGSAPSISGAIEIGTGSIYLLQPGTHRIQVAGSGFAGGATVVLGTDVSAQTTAVASDRLAATVTVAAGAALGPRPISVTNPDGGSAAREGALVVVKSTDVNRDCRVDGTDLNTLARAWNSTSTEARFDAACDLDGDGYVGPDDFAIFIEYFGQQLLSCS